MNKRKASTSSSSSSSSPAAKAKKRTAKNSLTITQLDQVLLDTLVTRVCQGKEMVDHGFSHQEEDLWCHRSTLPVTAAGYPKSLRLNSTVKAKSTLSKKQLEELPSNDYSWCAAAAVLVAAGKLPTSATDEASHLCNHPWCVRLEHLAWEQPTQNYSRKNCVVWTRCPCYCNVAFNPCSHNAKCLPLWRCTCTVHSKFNLV